MYRVTINDRTCGVCRRQFDRPSGLKKHLRKNSTCNGPQKCNFCDLNFPSGEDFRKHLIENDDCDSYQDRTVRQLQQQRDAKMVHHLNRPPSFICNTCGRTFQSLSKLKFHSKNRSCHPKATVSHTCEKCEVMFIKQGNFSRHSRKLCPDCRRAQCETCGKFFDSSGRLSSHSKKVKNGDCAPLSPEQLCGENCILCNKKIKEA